MTATLTVRDLISAIRDLAGIFLDERSSDYLKPVRGPLLTAINMQDGEAIAATVARAFQSALAQAGFKGHLTPDTLRAAIAEPTIGVRTLHDVCEGVENALGHFTRWHETASRKGFASPSRPPAAPQRDSLGHHRDSGRNHPQASRDGQGRPAPAAEDDNPLPGPRSHQAPTNGPAHGSHGDPSGRRYADPVPPQRAPVRGSAGNQANNVTPFHRAEPPHSERGRHQGDEGSGASGERNRFDQKNVYGSKASVQFSAGLTKATDRKEPRPTIFMEAARILDSEKRIYDWKNKLVLQMTSHELQVVTALLFGLIPSCRFSNHGHQGEADKWFEFEHQTDRYAGTIKIAIGKSKDVMICSMGAEDIGDVTAMFLRQCAEQMRIEQAAVPATLRVVAQAYNARNEAKGTPGGQRRYANG